MLTLPWRPRVERLGGAGNTMLRIRKTLDKKKEEIMCLNGLSCVTRLTVIPPHYGEASIEQMIAGSRDPEEIAVGLLRNSPV